MTLSVVGTKPPPSGGKSSSSPPFLPLYCYALAGSPIPDLAAWSIANKDVMARNNVAMVRRMGGRGLGRNEGLDNWALKRRTALKPRPWSNPRTCPLHRAPYL